MPQSVALTNVSRHFATAAGRFDALKPLSLEFDTGEYVGILGPSGSGKSTLLNLIAGIDRPSGGRIEVSGNDITTLGESKLAIFRGRHIGVVFQFFQLIPTLTALENVHLAMDLVGAIAARDRRTRAAALLDRLGLSGHCNKLPAALSGGEQQRVAIARALANDPAVLAADEPTGNLDTGNSERIDEIFRDCAAEGRTVLVATHDTGHLDQFSRLIRLIDGEVGDDSPGQG